MSNPSTLEATFHLTHALKQQLSHHLEAENLPITPMHVRVMMIIYKQANCTAIDIVNVVNRDKAQITRLIKGLIEQGLVERTSNPDDKRSQLLMLTKQGEVIQARLMKLSGGTQQALAKGIDPEDLATFAKVAQKMTQNLAALNT